MPTFNADTECSAMSQLLRRAALSADPRSTHRSVESNVEETLAQHESGRGFVREEKAHICMMRER